MTDPRSTTLTPEQIEEINRRVLASWHPYTHGGSGPEE